MEVRIAIPAVVIQFAPPMQGFEGRFNTFRLGRKMYGNLWKGQRVLLLDTKTNTIFGEATVEGVVMGKLTEMAAMYAHQNHNRKHEQEEGANERLIASMQKRYGPHRCRIGSIVTVIDLRRTC